LGGTVSRATSTLDFARALADKVAIMDRGAIVFSGAAAELDEQAVRRHLTV
jgi:urea transport system ATP-binding protein